MATPSFFDAYKELFEYEKHVGLEDPVTLSQRDGIGTKTFLDKYCECEQRQALELRATVPVPFVTTLMVDTSLMRPALLHYSSTGAPSVFASPMGSSHAATSLPNQHHQQLSYEQYSYNQHQQQQLQQQALLKPRPKTPGMSSFTQSRLESSLRQSMSSNQEDAVAAPSSSTLPTTSILNAPESQSPQHYQSSSRKNNCNNLMSPSKPTAVAPARSQRASTLPHPSRYQAPKLTDLLIDSSTRSATLRHRHVDEAKKIELLIGSNCGGRISAAAAATLPPSIRRRLQASINAPQRREQLYSVLRREYETLCASH